MKPQKQKILQYLQTIPKGKVATYSSIAKKFDTHPRAIATIMRTNKDPDIYPCYKVVNIKGELLGYNNGGPKKKKELLEADGVKFIGDRINLSSCTV